MPKKFRAIVESQSVLNNLQRRAVKAAANDKASAITGYNSKVAIFVHENMEMKLKGQPRRSGIGVYWGPNGRSKFLESPARLLRSDGTLGRIVVQAIKKGATMAQACFMACLRIQRESQKIVPVEYGNLRGSAFSMIEKG